MNCFVAIAPRNDVESVQDFISNTPLSSSAKADDPVFQRRRWLNREAAAYWTPDRSLSSGGHSADPVAGMTMVEM
jgi:hypothetical protein